MASTITDKTTFSVKIIDTERYNNLDQKDKVFFEGIRNSILEIFPVINSNTYHDISIKFAENHAFIFIQKMNDKIEERLLIFEEELNKNLQEKTNNLLNNGTTKI